MIPSLFRIPALARAVILACLGFSATAAPATLPEQEALYYPMLTIPIPEGIVLEAGAIQLLPGQRLAVSTRLGDIYLVDGAFENPPTGVKFTRFASGLHEVLGLWSSGDGWIYATQRGEVTRLRDEDNDGRADLIETVADGWGINGDYHEYAFGSKPDRDGNIWVALCLTGSFNSDSLFRGWALRITPDGRVLPTASGLRSPGGIATNSVGDMFYTDNQGPWNGTCWLKPLKPGGFSGHPGGFKWYAQATNLGVAPKEPVSGSRIAVERGRIPELVPPAIAFPYNKLGQSAAGIANDFTAGKFGPFTNQLFVGDQTWSLVMRVFLEKVNGVYQGACFPFREGFASGCLSLEMAPDGSMFVGGTDRGWGARGGQPFALQRLIWSGKTPFEVHEMSARPDGFELTFTEPVDPATAGNTKSYQFENYTYIYQASYGSPEVDRATPPIESATVGPDGRSVRLRVKLTPGHVHELKLPGVRSKSDEPVLHPVAYYWLNEIPAK
jgi:glucose/arabinose dehydrogenase